MGASVSWLSGLLWAKKEIRILILGLVCLVLQPLPSLGRLTNGELQDNAGKTTLLYRLKVCHPFSRLDVKCTSTDGRWVDWGGRYYNTYNRL
jgi:hypothetical protein